MHRQSSTAVFDHSSPHSCCIPVAKTCVCFHWGMDIWNNQKSSGFCEPQFIDPTVFTNNKLSAFNQWLCPTLECMPHCLTWFQRQEPPLWQTLWLEARLHGKIPGVYFKPQRVGMCGSCNIFHGPNYNKKSPTKDPFYSKFFSKWLFFGHFRFWGVQIRENIQFFGGPIKDFFLKNLWPS